MDDKQYQVYELLLTSARNESTISYQTMYKLFEEEKKDFSSEGLWRNHVWDTVESVCNELSNREGAIYFSLLANKDGVPIDYFIDSIYRARETEYHQEFGIKLPTASKMSDSQKADFIDYERSRVYRHYKKYHSQNHGT